MALAASGALLAAAAGLADKLDDSDLPRLFRPAARAACSRLEAAGMELATQTSLDPSEALAAPRRAAASELEVGPLRLEDLLEPSGAAVASLFAHTAVIAGIPSNAPALSAAGEAFGRLVHLLDAIADRQSDEESGKFNPLTATNTDTPAARCLAEELNGEIREALRRVEWRDNRLLNVLFGPVLDAALNRTVGAAPRRPAPGREGRQAGQRVAVAAIAAQLLGAATLCGRDRSGRSCCGDCCCDLECCCCEAECCEGCGDGLDCCSSG